MADLSTPPRRFVTGHSSDGSATIIYEGTVKETFVGREGADDTAKFSNLWQAKQPSDNAPQTEDASLVPVEICREDGSVCRAVDMPPHHSSQMHRTVSLDYGVVVAGELELELEHLDGKNEFRKLKIGDVVVQRGTNHAWHNRGDSWGRMVYVLIGADQVNLNGKTLEPIMHNIKDGKLGD
jgi:quercetin dioxygenase-like cupin family protein